MTITEATTEIRRTLNLFSMEGALIEVRALNCGDRNRDFKSTRTGLFEHEQLDEAAKYAIGAEKMHNATGVYVMLNPVRKDLLARAANRMVKAERGGTTKDDDIIVRRWMLIDLDPKRPAGVSSTDEELATAEEQAKECGRWLCDNGFPLPVIAMSGNGWHLLYRVDLPTADKRIESCLKALAAKFPLVDSSNHNPSRITKLYGTLARKGDSTTDRPHRRSKLVEVPDDINVVHPDCIDWLAAQAEKKSPSTTTTVQPNSGNPQSPVLERWLQRNFVAVLNREETSDATRFFIRCPGESAHTNPNADTDCCVTQDHTGRLGGKCVHNSCGMNSWAAIKDAIGPITKEDFPAAIPSKSPASHPTRFEPGTLVKCGDRGNVGTVVSDNGGSTVSVHFVSPDGNEATVDIPRAEVNDATENTSAMNIRSAATLIKEFPEQRPYVIDGLVRRGETMNIISAPKTGKSWLSIGLALVVCAGLKWLGQFWTKQGKVLIIDNELYPEVSSHRIPWVAQAMEINPEDYADRLFVANLRGQLIDLKKLAIQLSAMEPDEYSLIVLDAWYRFQPEGSDENSNSDVSALYNLLDSVAAKIGCAFVCIHHSSKGNQASKGVTDVGSGAGAQSRAPDAHLVMRSHEDPNAIVVEAAVRSFKPVEPFCIRWDFPRWVSADDLDPADLRQEKPRKRANAATTEEQGPSKEELQAKREAERREKVIEAYQAYPDGETKNVVRLDAGMSPQHFGPVNAALVREKVLIPCTLKKGKTEYPAFRLAGETQSNQSNQVDQNQSSSTSSMEVEGIARTTRPPLGGVVSSTPSTDSNQKQNPLFDPGQQFDLQHGQTDKLWLPPDRTNGGQPA